jgi:hypothetical protein
MRATNSNPNNLKTTINSGYRSKILIPMMNKPPPKTKIFLIKVKCASIHDQGKTERLNLPGNENE